MDLTAVRQDLALALTMLEREGIIDFNGHFSARLPDAQGLLINAADSVRSRIETGDFIEIDFEGRPLSGTRGAPMEFHLHAQIYRSRPDVQAIVHAHPPWSTVLTTAGHRWRPVTMQAAVLGAVPTFERTVSINSGPLGQELAQCLGTGKAALMRRHGMVTAAASVRDAFVQAIYLEENAHRQFLALQIGTPEPLSDEECATIGCNLSRPALLQKVWDYHLGRYLRGAGGSA
ncbi:MAG: class aldolase/adducin, N-terminal family protein [Ramlibacter sp.]|nr:class aldolase/adducin, N-terminal family protein [Ramlibacter sp.]